MRLLTPEEAADKLGLSVRSLLDKRWRIRTGLPATKIGRKVGFNEADIERLITKGRERLPIRSGETCG